MIVDVPIVVEIRYEIGRIIGDGNFAVVREGIDRLKNQLCFLVVAKQRLIFFLYRRTRDRFALKLIDKKRCQVKNLLYLFF